MSSTRLRTSTNAAMQISFTHMLISGVQRRTNRSSHVQILLPVIGESERPNHGQSSQNPSEVSGTAAAAASIKPTAYDAHEGKLWSNFADAKAARGQKYIQFHSH